MNPQSPAHRSGSPKLSRLFHVQGAAFRHASLAILLLVAAACLWPGMRAPLFSDDFVQLDYVAMFEGYRDVFRPDAFSLFRPVKNLIFMAAAPHSDQLPLWHLYGLAAFLLATVSVHRIALVIFRSGPAAILAAAVWALSPTCVSTALWLSCANLSLGIFFAGLAFELHERSTAKRGPWWMTAAFILYACAMLCYESFIVLPGLLFLRDLQQDRIRLLDRKVILRYAVYGILAVSYLLIRSSYATRNLLSETAQPNFSPDMDRWKLFLSAPWLVWRHLSMWLFPFGNIEVLGSYVWMKSASPLELGIAWGILLAVVATAVSLWRRAPDVSYGLLFFLTAFFPTSNLMPNYAGPVHDAYLTIPSIGLAIAVAAVARHLLRRLATPVADARIPAAAFVTALLVIVAYRLPLCAAYSTYWAKTWNSPSMMLVMVSGSRPYQFTAKGLASHLLYVDGHVDAADALARENLREAPWNLRSKLTLGNVLESQGRSAEAEKVFREVAENAGPQYLLGEPALKGLLRILSKDPSRHEECAQICRKLLGSNPKRHPPELICFLASFYKDRGDLPKARSTLERGLKIHPGDRELTHLLANLPAATVTNS